MADQQKVKSAASEYEAFKQRNLEWHNKIDKTIRRMEKAAKKSRKSA